MTMKDLQLRIVCLRTLIILSAFLLLPTGGVTVSFIRNVGQDAIFMWNRTSPSIFEAQWGFLNNGFISPSLIYINKFANRPILSSDLNTPAASRYKGRVFWVGDLNAGRAWYKITNLSINDTKQYAVRLQDGNGVDKIYTMILTVAAIPTFPHLPTSPYLVEVIEGRDLVINCKAIGPPTPTVQWYTSDGTAITSVSVTGTVTLTKTNVQKSQSGFKYKCVASNNPNSDPVSTIIQVIVLYPPHATVTSPSVTIVQGNVISLSCTVDGYPPPSISWTKADGGIKAGHTVAGGTLRIPDAIKTDAAKYICTAKNTYDSRVHVDTATTTVVVIYQPSIMLERLHNQTVNETGSLSIKCDTDGYPPPTIKWKTPTGSVHTGNVYNITSVSRSHAGTYTCTASNGIGREAIANIQVTVQYKPAIEKSRSSQNSKSWNGNSIHLKCFATGLPAPQIYWYKPTNQQITTGINIVPGGSEVTVLTTIDQGDYGRYKCRVSNILGSDEHVINVTQQFLPGPVTILITDIEASSITVRWTQPADDGGTPVTGYLLQVSTKPPVITVNTHAVITGLNANTQYTVKVYSENAIGYGVPSSKVIRTKTIGKPAAPELLTALLQATGSKLSVLLRWREPGNNGDSVSQYTIYMKEVERKADWIKYADIKKPRQLSYRVTDNIVYGKTYMFMVTAWNKYGESVKDERSAKTVNTTADEETASNAIKNCTEGGPKSWSTIVGVIIAILVLSLGFNLLLLYHLRKRVQRSSKKQSPTQNRKLQNKAAPKESYENELELENRTTSRVQPQPVQTGPEYESIQPSNPNEARSFDDISYYQGLNLVPNTSPIQGTHGPVYEPLRTRSVEPRMQHNDKEQHPYEPLNVKNQNSTYQSLQTNSQESVI